MKLFFASQTQKIPLLVSEGVQNILTSYAFCKNSQSLLDSFQEKFSKNLMIDSGAFSVWSNDEHIDLDSYIRFCKELKELVGNKINLYFINLDVLPGRFGIRPTKEEREKSAQDGWNNLLKMQEASLDVIHVFHQHEDFSWLDRLSKHLNYIGISPANDVSMKEKLEWLNKCFYRLKDKIKQGLKTHGFAVTADKQLYKYPFYSVDSSSWSAGARYGRIPTFDGHNLRTFRYKDKKDLQKRIGDLTNHSMKMMEDKDENFRMREGIRSYVALGEKATSLWTKRGIIWD